ncbi:hypothetical protein D3C86_1300330 [compost metagenome]
MALDWSTANPEDFNCRLFFKARATAVSAEIGNCCALAEPVNPNPAKINKIITKGFVGIFSFFLRSVTNI